MGRFEEKTRVARLRWFGHVSFSYGGKMLHWEKDVDDGTARKDETGKT